MCLAFSLAHWVPVTEVFSSHFRSELLVPNGCAQHLSSGTLNSRRRWAMCRHVVPGTALQSLSNTAAPAPLEFCSLPFPLTKPRKGPPYSLLCVVRTLQPEVTLLHPLVKNRSFPLLLNQTQSCSAGSATGGPL